MKEGSHIIESIITLTTDFGQGDGYVGAMKGVILSIAPGAQLVDISHEISPGDVRQAAFVLHNVAPYFPAGTIHVVVVDPGVGSARRAIAARTPQATFVAPDNGVLSLCLAGPAAAGQVECRQLSEAGYHLAQVSLTFHGRDIFAPVAAHLATGAAFEDLGLLVTDWVRLSPPTFTRDPDGAWRGQVWHVDHFGNLVTTIGKFKVSDFKFQSPIVRLSAHDEASNLQFQADQVSVEIAGRQIAGLVHTYAERAPGELVVLVGSSGYLEIAVRDGSAARTLNARPGDTVRFIIHHEP